MIKHKRNWVCLTDDEIAEVKNWIEYKEIANDRIITSRVVKYVSHLLKDKNLPKEKALRIALEALEAYADIGLKENKALKVCEDALAQSDWVELTNDEVKEFENWIIFKETGNDRLPTSALVKYLSEKLKEKNCGDCGECTDEKAVVWDASASFVMTPNPAFAKREWVGLTDEEIEQGCKESWVTLQAWQSAVWWAEAKLKEKNR